MRLRPALGKLPWHLISAVIGFSFLLPLLWMLSTALKAPGAVFETPIQWIPNNPRWGSYSQVFLKLPLFARFFCEYLLCLHHGNYRGSVIFPSSCLWPSPH